MPIRVLSCDIGGVIANSDLSISAALTALSSVPDPAVEAAVREHLHRSPEITHDAVNQVAATSCLPAQTVWQVIADAAATPVDIDPNFRPLLESLVATAPDLRVVLTSNATAAARDNNARVLAHLTDLVSGSYLSYEIGEAKAHDWQV